MKRLFLLFLSTITLCIFGGCSSTTSLDIADADNIQLRSEKYGFYVSIKDKEALNQITQNFNQLELKESNTSEADAVYTLTWSVLSGDTVCEIQVKDDAQIQVDGITYTCTDQEHTVDVSFLNEQLGIYTMIVKVLDASSEAAFLTADVNSDTYQLSVPKTFNGTVIEADVDDLLEITYNGEIAESSPAQFTKIYDIQVLDAEEK